MRTGSAGLGRTRGHGRREPPDSGTPAPLSLFFLSYLLRLHGDGARRGAAGAGRAGGRHGRVPEAGGGGGLSAHGCVLLACETGGKKKRGKDDVSRQTSRPHFFSFFFRPRNAPLFHRPALRHAPCARSPVGRRQGWPSRECLDGWRQETCAGARERDAGSGARGCRVATGDASRPPWLP